MHKKVHLVATLTCMVIASVGRGSDVSQPLVVHEWGTFTVLQDDAGNPVDGVNINEESLPAFVHKLAANLAPDSHELGALLGLRFQPLRSKGIARYYHAARMRMETPIIYLYPPKDQPQKPIDVNVDFNGGWITEWYPNAEVNAPGYKKYDQRLMMKLTPSTTGSIRWSNLKTAQDRQAPETDFPVWIAPRQTEAPMIGTAEGESENYLFYRGVANLEAPLRVVRDGESLTVHANDRSTCPIEDFEHLYLWLVDVGPEGELQYRRVSMDVQHPEPGQAIATTTESFARIPGKGLTMLRDEMLAALIDSGLFRDEAEAMLNTWEVSYFQAPGLRLFFTLPQSWTDRVLPLQVTGYKRTRVVRAMIGRIELISARQRELMRQLAKGPISNPAWFVDWRKANHPKGQSKVNDLMAGRITLEELGLKPPADYKAYMALGRFRDALIQHQIMNPTQKASSADSVKVIGPLIEIQHPAIVRDKVSSMTMTLPGEKRVINLAELEIYSDHRNIMADAKLSQSSNFEGRFPVNNLVDDNKNSFAHTKYETNPWVRVDFAHPVSIDEVRIWNRNDFGGRFADRFDGAVVAFFNGDEKLAEVEVRTQGSPNLRAFAQNYDLPRR